MPRGRPKSSGKQVQQIPVSYDPAESVAEIAKELIPKYHPHLVNSEIAYVFKNKEIKKGGKVVLATAEKCSPKVKFLSGGKEFVITVSFPSWQSLTDKQKRAVVDHELMHCLVDDDDESGEKKLIILPHDVEEFYSIIERNNLWKEDLVALGRVVKAQLNGKNTSVKVDEPEPEEDPDLSDDDESEESEEA